MKTAVIRAAGLTCLILQLAAVLSARAELLAIGPYGVDRRHVSRFDSTTGEPIGSFTAYTEAFYGLCADSGGQLYVTSNVMGDGDVFRFGPDGTFLGAFGTTNLHTPTGITCGPDGRIYVLGSTYPSSPALWQVLRFDAATGAFLGYFVPARPEHTNVWTSLAFGPSGDLYVCDSRRGILKFDGRSGQSEDMAASVGTGALTEPSAFAFGADGELYVSCRKSNAILRYDSESGTYLDTFVAAGAGGLEEPGALALGPDGHLYVAANAGILRFSGKDGSFLGLFVPAAGPPSSAALLFTPDVPKLQIKLRSDFIEVSWPAGSGAWRLLSNTARETDPWLPVTNAPARLQSKHVVTVPAGHATCFFRLEQL